MAFEIHPVGHTEPLDVAGSTTSATQTLTELTAPGPSGNPEMYILINGVDTAGAGTVIGVEPAFTLRFGTSTAATLSVSASTTAEVNDGFLGHTCQLTLSRVDLLQNLWRVHIVLAGGDTGSAWSLNIANNEGAARRFVWVVASSEAEAAQPWIHVSSEAIDFDANGLALSNEATIEAIPVKNFGTGPLSITPQAVSDAAFSIGGLPATLEPNHSLNLPLTFTAPASAGAHSLSHTLVSNDSIGQNVPGTLHNQQFALHATSSQVETVLLLDGSGSMSLKPDGTSAANPSESRWARLRDGAEHFLDLLAAHAPNGGEFGVALFPDVTSASADDINSPTSRELVSHLAISSGNVADAKAALGITPRGWTPIGHGIQRAVGAGASPGMFLGTANALAFNRRTVVLMTDGAHNSPPLPGSPKPADFFQAGAGTSDVLHNKHIGVIGVAYGVDGSPEVDRTGIQTLVTESGAPVEAFVDAVAPVNPANPDPLFKAFRKALLANLELHSASDPRGTLTDAVPEARHPVTITHYDKRVSFVVNWQGGANEVAVALVTPNCDVITASSADEKAGVTFRGGARYAIFTVESAYLRNDAEPLRPRFGTWRIIVSRRQGGENAAARVPVVYEYDVITASGIKLKPRLDGSVRTPGEPLTIRARLAADGVPIRNASVSVKLAVPDSSLDNFLARNRVTLEEFAKAKDQLKGGFDARSQTIKTLALRNKGITFKPSLRSYEHFLHETEDGHYEATLPGFSSTGNRTLLLVATGETADAVSFRREQELTVQVVARPRPQFTDVVLDYIRGEDGIRAVLQLFARDAFGNALVFDPELEERVVFVAAGAERDGRVQDRLDGSYSQTLKLGRSASTDVLIDDEVVVKGFAVPNPGVLRFVDQVVSFEPGREAKRGANAHAKPEAVLGSLLDKPASQFVSLGGRGVLTLGFKDPPVGARAVTVFVAPELPPRSYAVEATPDPSARGVLVQAEFAKALKGGLKRGRAAIEHIGGPAVAMFDTVFFGVKPTELTFVANGVTRSAGHLLRVVLDTGEVIAELRTTQGTGSPTELSVRTKPVSGRHAFAIEFDTFRGRLNDDLGRSGAGIFDWFAFRQPWVALGTSKGFTATFALPPQFEKCPAALRIVDTSDRTLDERGAPSETPGISVRAVGVELG